MLGEGVIFGDEDVGTGSTVASFGVSADNHVASPICGAIIGVRGQVIKKLVYGKIGGFSGCGLLGTQGAEGGNEFVADCTCVVEESANDALNSFDTFCG